MRGPHWVENVLLSAEVNALMGRGGFTVYEDMMHNCYHIVRGEDDEFTSAPMPWDEATKELLRRQSWIMHNNESQREMDYFKEQMDKVKSDGDRQERELCEDMAKSIARWGDGHIMFTPK